MNGTVTKTVELKGQGVPLHVEVPSRHRHLVFKNAKVGEVSTLSFSVINRSLVEINGHVVLLPVTSLSGPQLKTLLDSKEVWLVPHSSVIIAVGQSIEASVNFKPAARITGFDARLCFVTDQQVIVELASVHGKCDGLDIVLDEQTVDFGAVVLGGWVKRNLLLRSQGELGAYFTWDTALLAPHYTIKPDKGYIPAKGQLLLEVIFTPAFLSSDIRVLDIQCTIPHNKSPVKLNLIGACLPPVLPKEVFNFECPVRESDRKQLTITNTTATPWNLKPLVSNPVWTVPQQVTVRANSSEHFEAIFRPIESKPQQGLVTVILPAGQSQVFSLAGKTLPPKPNGRIGKEVPCRVPHKELLLVNNWLQKSQSFNVTFEYIKPDKVDPAIELTGNSMVHVPPMGHSQYELTFKALRDRDVNAVYTYKIVFKNADGEYQYYDIQYKVGRGPMYDLKTITAPVRTSRREIVKVVNPLETNVTISCQLQGVAGEITLEPSIPTLVPGKKEMDLVVEYFPLKPGSTQGRIDIGSTELGIFSVELNLHATLPKPEPPVTFAASLGGTASQICTLRNHSRTKAEFAVKIVEGATEFQLINEKSVYSLPPGSSHNPTEMNLDIMFDPIKLGKSRGRLVASSASGGGEFVFILEGTCLRPQPRGPFALQSPATDLQPPLEFRNPFSRPCSFKVSSSNRAFQVRENTDVIKSKKTAGIGVSFNPALLALDGETAKENSLLSQITVIPIFEGVPPVEEVAEWVYYIKCTL
ncbi:hypothetical protein RvY_17597 [Ramazzottius varieornatus]|uniref:Abnormal spindle-like microcephaly-associated protein ASH domain-containing protein n=1 Tax=Ramazzottius varieornatus TaxID=947166 RepID=A0A1D1W9M2_RAMVA|nr:hypothetical protein RvY_17597 [Ramazzottius varieornatus]